MRPVVAGIGVLTLAVSIGLAVVPAQAVHDEGFELDAALDADGVYADQEGWVDWDDLFTVTTEDPDDPETIGTTSTAQADPLPGGFIEASFQEDWVLPDPSGYATGTKDTLPISLPGAGDWQCKTPNNLGSKFDIVNAYAAAYVPSTGPATDDLIVYFGSEISAPEGNRNMGLWLLQDKDVACSGAGNTDFEGSHRDGDVFIVNAFTNGGSSADIDVYEWQNESAGTGDADVGGELVLLAAFEDVACPNVDADDYACAASNTNGDKIEDAGLAIDPPWEAPDKDGGNIGEAQFVEGALNLSGLGLTGCYSTFLANSRSSQETTSTLHDFAVGEFETCGKLQWLKKDEDGNFLGGATFRVCGPDSTTTCVTIVDNTGQASYTGLDTDDDAGKFELVDLQPGVYTIKETVAPPGYALDPDTETVTVGRGGAAQPTTAFVDRVLYKMIVLTCNTATEKLVDSTVDLDGSAATTNDQKETLYVSPSDPTDPLHGLCATGGAVYDDLPRATYTPTVEIPDLPDLFPPPPEP